MLFFLVWVARMSSQLLELLEGGVSRSEGGVGAERERGASHLFELRQALPPPPPPHTLPPPPSEVS